MFYTWKKIADPATGWLASKTSGWTADSFSGGLEVDFSSVVPAGTKAVRISIDVEAASGTVWWRASGDTNISNTPSASGEYAQGINGTSAGHGMQAVVWLSNDRKVQFAVESTSMDINISYPVEYLL